MQKLGNRKTHIIGYKIESDTKRVFVCTHTTEHCSPNMYQAVWVKHLMLNVLSG